MKHLRLFENFEPELLQNLNGLFRSEKWQERFALIGNRPQHGAVQGMGGSGPLITKTDNSNRVIMKFARASEVDGDHEAPYQVLFQVTTKEPYRAYNPGGKELLGEYPSTLTVRLSKTPGVTPSNYGFTDVNGYDIPELEDEIIQGYVEFIRATLDDLVKNDKIIDPQLGIFKYRFVEDAILGKMDRAAAVQRVAEYLVDLAKRIDGNIIKMAKLVPSEYKRAMYLADGYSPEDADAMDIASTYGIV
jgi:hypothetical protein